VDCASAELRRMQQANRELASNEIVDGRFMPLNLERRA
jgi:hypothetical protein